MDIAFFDFDGTISRKDSFGVFLKFILKERFYPKLLANLPLLLLYKAHIISNTMAKEGVLKSSIKGIKIEDFKKLCKEFLPELEAICKDSALEKIAWHKAQNHKIVIVSASLEEYLSPFSDKLKIDLIASKLEVLNGSLTGKLATKNCYGEQKVERIRQRYDLSKYDKIYVYGDSRGDREMLELASEGCKFYRNFT